MSLSSESTLSTPEVATELGPAVYELVAQQIDVDEFTRRFLASRVYTLCPVNPGLFVMSRPGGSAIVPVWSTVRALRQVMGGFDWLACRGEELVAHLPDGVGVLIDDGMPCPIALPSADLLQYRCSA
jgi:hypothetical protein